MNSKEVFKLEESRETAPWYSGPNEEIIKKIRDIYIKIADATFDQRFMMYVNKMCDSGFFDYAGWKLFPDQNRFELKSISYHLGSYTLGRSTGNTGHIELAEKNDNLGGKMKKFLLSSVPPRIDTVKDPDILFAILEKYFGIRW